MLARARGARVADAQIEIPRVTPQGWPLEGSHMPSQLGLLAAAREVTTEATLGARPATRPPHREVEHEKNLSRRRYRGGEQALPLVDMTAISRRYPVVDTKGRAHPVPAAALWPYRSAIESVIHYGVAALAGVAPTTLPPWRPRAGLPTPRLRW